MDDAWQQIGDVLDANARIRRLHLATDVSIRWYARHLTPLVAADPERAFAIAAPVAGHALVGGSTLAQRQTASLVPPVLTSTALRRVLRPQARLMRALPFDATAEPRNLLARVNAAEVSAAPPKVVPPGVATVDQAADAAEPQGVPRWVLELLSRFPWLPLAVVVLGHRCSCVLLLFAAPLGLALAVGLPLLAALVALAFLLRRWQRAHERARSLSEAGQTPEAVDQLPQSPDFVLSEPGSNVTPTTGASDSPTAVRFKAALRDSFALLVASNVAAERPAPATLDLR